MREFESVLMFAEHLVTVEIAVREATHKGLDQAASLIQRDAQAQIGFYQGAVGPFQDWAPLADSTEDEKLRLGYEPDAPLLREGDLRNSIEREIDGEEAIVGSKSDSAGYQEFGTSTIPPRPFIGPAAFRNKEKVQAILGAALVAGLTGGEAIHESLGYDMDLSRKV